jgi:hypothetical protein
MELNLDFVEPSGETRGEWLARIANDPATIECGRILQLAEQLADAITAFAETYNQAYGVRAATHFWLVQSIIRMKDRMQLDTTIHVK